MREVLEVVIHMLIIAYKEELLEKVPEHVEAGTSMEEVPNNLEHV